MSSKRRRHTGVIVGIVLAVLLVAAASGTGYMRYQRAVPTVVPTTAALKDQTGKAPTLPWPEYGQSAIGASGFGVLATNGDQKAAPTASVAKVITALAIVKQKPIKTGTTGATLTMTDADYASYQFYLTHDGSNVPVAVGEQITQYQALQALLLPSANNMAESLARWAFGSLEAYKAYVNGPLTKELSVTTMKMTDPSGFDAGTVASASDLVKIGIAALQEPVLAEIFNQPQANIPVAGNIYNVNRLLGQNGFIGIKTGNTEEAGGVFLFATKQQTADGQPVTVVGAIMGAPSLTTAMRDSVPLSIAVPGGFENRTIVTAGQVVGSYTMPWGGTVNVTADKDLTALLWKPSKSTATVELTNKNVPQSAGMTVGTVNVTANGKELTTAAVLAKPLTTPDWWWRLTH